MLQYRADARQGIRTYQNIAEAGFRCYSQFEEDGILLYVLSVIGMKTRKVVEICCGDGDECMAANLILNHGYSGYLFDGDVESIRRARSFYLRKKDCMLSQPSIQHAWITRSNVNQLLLDVGASGEVDLLSLDIDGNDYYIWEAISAINPRLCVFETHNVIPANLSLTIPYTDDFYCWKKQGAERDFRSVSLLAMKKLSQAKGYRLIGAHRHGFNVFFLRNDIAQAEFPEVSVEQVHDNPFTRQAQAERWPPVKNMDWKQV
ncbi:MAG: hypothetical protein P4L03_04205 [Terracidiphilus sp.]|nr:hypothetical protein [Terracidiphilus sp.]